MIWMWTEEEFKDIIIKASVVGVVSFCLVVLYSALDKYLKET